MPHTVVIDDYLPIMGYGKNHFSKRGDDGALWMPLLEKALAKAMGNYFHLHGGYGFEGTHYMNGSPYSYFYNYEESADGIWSKLTAHDIS